MLMTTPAGTTATPTNVTDPEFGFEIAEVFAMALLRDKPFATSLENYVPPGSRYKLGR